MSQAILVENFDPEYLVFERAAALRRADSATHVLVPVPVSGKTNAPNAVSKGVAELMAGVAHLPAIELVPIEEREPITLNAARQLREVLTQRHITSVTVVAPGFRSERSRLVYTSVLAPAGITVRCVPVFGSRHPDSWTSTWHGIQEVGLQLVKLQYYRWWVLL